MLNVFRRSHRVLFLGFVLIIENHLRNGANGEQCSSYESLENGNCEPFVNGTLDSYRTVECKINRYNGWYLNSCLSSWCHHIASCLNQTLKWKTLCSRKFYRFRSSQFDISTVVEGLNVSYVRNIYVKKCGKTYPDSDTVSFKFAVKTTGFRCQSEEEHNAPYTEQWIGSFKCDKLVNGTESSWYKFYSTRDWCESFETCLQSMKLKEKCLTDFRFYNSHFWYWPYYPAFTFDVSNYLPNTRIQVYYQRGYGNSYFVVNIIRCESTGKYNGSEVDTGDGVDEDEDDYDLNEEMMNAINTLDVQNNDSLQNAVNVFDAKMKDYLNRTSILGTYLIKTGQENMEELFMATVAFEEFALRFGQHHLTQSVPLISLSGEKVGLQIRRRFHENESDFHLEESNGLNYISIPLEDLHNDSVLLGVVYKDLHEMFVSNQTNSNTNNESSNSLNTIIMSATIRPEPVKLKENVTLVFTNVQEATRKRECVFWNFLENSPIGWSGQGCHVKSMDDSKTECTCNHLTHFAVLMQFNSKSTGNKDNSISKTDEKILEILTYLGLTLSLFGITLTIICYVFLTDVKAPLSQIRVSLVSSLGAGQIIFLAGIGATENKGACVAVAALVQYFFMAAFCWMLIEGVYLYLFVVKVYNVSNKMKICHGMSWGFPVVMVSLTLSIAAGKNGIESFVSREYCWMTSSSGQIWIFVLFVVAVELLNVLILVRVIKEMTTMQQAKDNQAEQIRLGIKACVVLIPLLGVTWLFGLLSSTHKAFVYIFTIFNSAQGFFIFLLHCARNTEIRERLKRRVRLIFPAASNGASNIKRSSEMNDSSGIVSLRKIEVLPGSVGSQSNETMVQVSL